MDFFVGDENAGPDLNVEDAIDKHQIAKVKEAALKVSKKRPIIVAIDTLEQYKVKDEALMNAFAALIEYAADFNLDYADKGIHLKVFISGEVFPHLKEAVLLNPLKAVQHPVYLLWRPRDLLRFIGWRLFYNLEAHGYYNQVPKIDWDDDDDVLAKIWIPHFGETLQNATGQTESTWPYILRHTQMRPRQLIFICNSIANIAISEKTFPNFSQRQIVSGVREAETHLASEILNSYSEVYKNAHKIVTSALTTLPKVFKGNELDRRASQSAQEWEGDYSPANFKQLVAELGIIGRVTRGAEEIGYIDADFEYASTERLVLTHRDMCVVHPMFYHKLNIEMNSKARVMPFTTPRNDDN